MCCSRITCVSGPSPQAAATMAPVYLVDLECFRPPGKHLKSLLPLRAPDTGALVTPACASLSSMPLDLVTLHAPVQRRTVSGLPASTRCGASSRCSPRRTLTSRPRQVGTAMCCKDNLPLTTCVAAAVFKAHVGVGKGASNPRKPQPGSRITGLIGSWLAPKSLQLRHSPQHCFCTCSHR